METTTTIIDRLRSHYGNYCRQMKDDHWIFEVATHSGRSQVVHLFYRPVQEAGKDVSRFITLSPIGPVFRQFEYEKVLRRNSELQVGTICIEDLANHEQIAIPYLTLRATHMAATLDYEEAWELIDLTGTVADQLEDEIFAKDTH